MLSKRTLPPPTAVTVYELTDAGRALRSSIRALSEWGEQHGAPATESQHVRPSRIVTTLTRRPARLEAGQSCELRVGRDVFEVTSTGGEVSIAAGSAASPDAVVTIEPQRLYALATRRVGPEAARTRVELGGDPRIAARLLEGLSGCASSG